jgi:predicted nucleic acid-binding protein
MPEVFADTAGWANFFVRTEPFHVQAAQLMQQWHNSQVRIITTNYILTELVALFTSPLRVPRVEQIRAIETIKAVSWVEIIHIDASLDEEAWQLLKQRPDKSWSLVDCASIVVMQHRHITTAFTTDHHFEQAGFINALK